MSSVSVLHSYWCQQCYQAAAAAAALWDSDSNQGMTALCVCFTETMAKRVAVILSGCGVYDGTEVHEASAVLVHLSRAGAKVRTRKEEKQT